MSRNTSSRQGPPGPKRGLVLFGRMLRRGPLAAIACVVCVLFGAGTALAYWPASGSGNTTATVATLAPPTNVSAMAITSGVSVSWTASAGAVTPSGYYVTRITGGTPMPACDSGPSALITATSCTDTAPGGSHAYQVTAVYRSWTAVSQASATVDVVLSLNNLVVTSQPGISVVAGSAIATVRVEAQTALGLPVANVPVTISLGTNPGGGSLSGTVSATTNGSGVATFSGLSIHTAGTGYTLVASSGGYSNVATTSFTVTAAAATQLVVTSPASVTGVASATASIGPVTVERRDAYGNPTTAGSTTVTLTASSGGTGLFAAAAGGPGITSVNIAAGLASTAFYYGDTKSGSRPFTATGLGEPLTVPVEITAAAPSHLKFGTISSPVPKNGFSVTVWILDAFENQTQSTATVALTSTGQPPTGPQNKCTVVIPAPSHAGSGTWSDRQRCEAGLSA